MTDCVLDVGLCERVDRLYNTLNDLNVSSFQSLTLDFFHLVLGFLVAFFIALILVFLFNIFKWIMN
jgi:hypothetical protein